MKTILTPRNGFAISQMPGISRQETSTNDPSSMSDLLICKAMPNAISSQESEGGHLDLAWQDGQVISRFGPDRAHASPFPQRASKKDFPIGGTCGQSGAISSASNVLQSYLESNLHERLTGSDLCEVIWKPWVTPWGQSRLRPRARVRTSLATDFGLWPRPTSLSFDGSHQPGNSRNMNKIRNHVLAMLGEATSGVAGVMAKSGALTPALICSLMEFPAEWESCAPSETQFRRRLRRPSFKAR